MQKNTEVNYPTGLYVPYSTRTHPEDALNENIKSDPSWPKAVQLFPHKYWRTLDISFATENSK